MAPAAYDLFSVREPDEILLEGIMSSLEPSLLATPVFRVDSFVALTLTSTTAGLATEAAAAFRAAGDLRGVADPECALGPAGIVPEDNLEGLGFLEPSCAGASPGVPLLEECRLPLNDLLSDGALVESPGDLTGSESRRLGVGLGNASRGLLSETWSPPLSSAEIVTISLTLPTDALILL